MTGILIEGERFLTLATWAAPEEIPAGNPIYVELMAAPDCESTWDWRMPLVLRREASASGGSDRSQWVGNSSSFTATAGYPLVQAGSTAAVVPGTAASDSKAACKPVSCQ